MLFDEIDTLPPEQKRFAGKVLIIGGSQGAFFAPAQAMQTALNYGAGEVRVLLPESLRKQVPKVGEICFAEAQSSGAFGTSALQEFLIQADWADVIILIGDLGRNSETAILMADFMKHCDKPVFITRDAVDVAMPDVTNWGMREQKTALFLTMSQLQKLFRTIYYPKAITLSMPTNQLIETLHKFTLSYPMALATYHNEQVVVACDGQIISEDLKDVGMTPITLWGGEIIVRAAILSVWNGQADLGKVFATALNSR